MLTDLKICMQDIVFPGLTRFLTTGSVSTHSALEYRPYPSYVHIRRKEKADLKWVQSLPCTRKMLRRQLKETSEN